MKLFRTWLVWYLAHFALSQRILLRGELWRAPAALTDYWDIPVDGQGACSSEQVIRLNEMWKDMQMVGAMLRDFSTHDDIWDAPPKWFLDLATSMFAIEDWTAESGPDATKKDIMKYWASWVSGMLLNPPALEKTVLVCDSDLMQMMFPGDSTPTRSLLGDLLGMPRTVKEYIELFSEVDFEKFWWFHIPRLDINGAWVRLPKRGYDFPPYTYQYPTVAHSSKGSGLPFQTRPNDPNFPTYCAGVRARGDALALTVFLDRRPMERLAESDPEDKMIILCPEFFKNPTDRLDLNGQVIGTFLEAMKPAWHPWFHELFHLRYDIPFPGSPPGVRYDAREADSVFIEEGSLASPGSSASKLQKSMFGVNDGRTWGAMSCIALALYEMADPKLKDGYKSETVWNPETWAWFATAGVLTESGPWRQDWSTGKCTGSYPPAFIDGNPPPKYNKEDPTGVVPPYPGLDERDLPVEIEEHLGRLGGRYGTQTLPSMLPEDTWQYYSSPESNSSSTRPETY